MAGESDLERTEEASPRRLEQAREEGQVARSQELSTFAVLMAGGLGLWVLGRGMFQKLSYLVESGLTLPREAAFDPAWMISRLYEQGWQALSATMPLLALTFIAALCSPLLLNGWLFSAKALQPQLSRIDPLQGLARMLSMHGLIVLVKAVIKTLIVGSIAVWVVWHYKDAVLGLSEEPMAAALPHLGNLVGLSFLAVCAAMLPIVAIDVPFQLWDHHRKLRMSKEELRKEAKETEGDPQIKSRIRMMQREMARRRMMAEVPKADVVVTNPTHYAVALRYKADGGGAPRVVAKGSELVAARIRELAREHNVPLVEAPPLARALHSHTELGDEIPEALYAAVAEVLAYVYQLRLHLKSGGLPPREPRDLPVPKNLDPLAEPA